MNTTPIYYQSATYARDHGELEQYRASGKASIDCRGAIDKAIDKHFDGMHLGTEALTDVLEWYPVERVAVILAVTIKDRWHDGRFSRSNKEWANTVAVPPENECFGYSNIALRSHSTIINGYVDMFRKARA